MKISKKFRCSLILGLNLLFLGATGFAQTTASSELVCGIQHIAGNDTGKIEITDLALTSKPLPEKTQIFLSSDVAGTAKLFVAAYNDGQGVLANVYVVDYKSGRRLSQTLILSPKIPLNLDISDASNGGFKADSIRLHCELGVSK
jgi:hypothetical protein